MRPNGQRLEPLGASDDAGSETTPQTPCPKCLSLEEERDFLQTSLFALTTHFAQVQLRLRQVVEAPAEEQQDLLKILEEFAFRDTNLLKNEPEGDLIDIIKQKQHKQKLIVARLKSQLKELKLFDRQADKGELVASQDLERQLRVQIGDLERFIEYLKSAGNRCVCKQTKKTLTNYLIEIVERSLQIFALFQFNWTRNCFTISTKTNHWGDLRARLELAIIDLKNQLHSREDPKLITLTVRRCLATSIRDLMQHGTTTHSWDIILHYYRCKGGDDFNSSTTLKLSRSFDLEIAGVSLETYKTNLLYTIGSIISTHSRYKRSNDSHFKAFVCAALNAKSLVSWLNLIFQSDSIVETFYCVWSYVAKTRYQDSLRSLDGLTRYKFDLPVDLDVRRFQTEDDAFV